MSGGAEPGDGDDHGDEVVIECSAVADEQLDEIENSDSDLYNDILTVCELVMTSPDRAQSMSTAIQADEGTRMRLAVPGRHPYKVFWSTEGPRIEAVFPHP